MIHLRSPEPCLALRSASQPCAYSTSRSLHPLPYSKRKGLRMEPGSRGDGEGRLEARVGPPDLCFWTGSRHGSPTWSESQEASGAICGGKGEKPCHSPGWPHMLPRAKAGPTTCPHWRKRSTVANLQSQFSGKKLRTRMSSSSISSSSCRSSRAGDHGGGE